MSQSPTRHRFLELDALRGLAAFAVMIFHFTTGIVGDLHLNRKMEVPNFPVGRFGVHVFFIISGFVIFYSLTRAPNIKVFAVHRFARLFPTYWASIPLGLVFIIAVKINAYQPMHLFVQTLANLTMLQELFLQEDIITSYWTLIHELCFYVQIALLMKVSKWPIEPVLLSWLLTAGILKLCGIHIPYRVAIFTNFDYGHLFILGIALYLMFSKQASKLTPLLVIFALLDAPILESAFNGQKGFIVWMPLICELITITAILLRPGFLLWRPLLWLGRISYSLYLIHLPIGYFIITKLIAAGVRDIYAILAAVVGSTISGYIFYSAIERPGQKLFLNYTSIIAATTLQFLRFRRS